MRRLTKAATVLRSLVALALCLALPAGSWANLLNTASVSFKDAANNSYGPIASNTVTVVTPPVVSNGSITGDVGVAIAEFQIVATNGPIISYSAPGLPLGLTLNSTTGKITGIPTTAGTTVVNMTATNAAGPSAAATLTITIRGAANIALTKSANPLQQVVGQQVTFTIHYANSGSGVASTVQITDVIPAGSTYVAGSADASGGSYNSSTRTITWTVPTVNAGASGDVSFKVTVD